MESIASQLTSKDKGMWIGIINGKVIARDNDAEKVFKKLEKLYPDQIPTIINIPSTTSLLL